MDTISGLPLHPLVVHGVVVLGPLAALMLVAYVAVPRWRVGLRWPTLVLAVGSAIMGKIAEGSGEDLEHRVMGAGGAADALIRHHAEAGELASAAIIVLALVALATILYLVPATGARSGANVKKMFATLALVASIGSALFVMYAVVNAGHSGAKSVWSSVISSSN